MTEEELLHALPQYKRFLWCVPLPWLVFLFGNAMGLPVWVGVLAVVAMVLTPIMSLWFSLPVAKFLGRPVTGYVLLTLFIPFGFVFVGVVLLRAARGHLTSRSSRPPSASAELNR